MKAAVAFLLLAQFPWFPPGMDGEIPSCDRSVEWLRAHNFSVCDRTIIRDERCKVLENGELECVVIPRPVGL
jgi:hypothetical protein